MGIQRRALAVMVVSVGAGLIGGCADNTGSIPPPPVRPPAQPLSERAGDAPATQPDVNGPRALRARIEQHLAEMQSSTRPAGAEVPRISDLPADTGTAGSATKSPTVTAAPATTQPATPSAVEFSTPAVPAAAPAQSTAAPVTPVPVVATPAAEAPVDAAAVTNVPTPPGSALATPASTSASPAPRPDDIEAAVVARASRDPRDVAAALDTQLLAYLRELPAPSAQALTTLPMEDREIVSAVVDALVNFRATVRADPNSMYAAKVKPLADLSERLRTRADLSVPVATLCSDVKGFGIYEPAPAMLSSRSETRSLLYYEVAHFTSRFSDARMWETRLSQVLTLYDATGRVIWQDRTQLLTDQCRNRRNDFFVRSPLRLPPVPPGRFTLKITVTDLNVGRVAEAAVPMQSP